MDTETKDRLERKWLSLTTEGVITPGVVKERNPLMNPPDWYDADRYAKAQHLGKRYFLR